MSHTTDIFSLFLLKIFFFRKDWFVFTICLGIILIGLPVIGIKKYIAKKPGNIVHISSNIFTIPTLRTPEVESESSFEMETFHNVQPTNQISTIEQLPNSSSQPQISSQPENSIQTRNNPQNQMVINNVKYNKNVINFTSIILLGVLYIMMSFIPIASRNGWINEKYGGMYLYLHTCFLPLVLSAMYFMCKPNHLYNVLKDLQCL